jgi:hypothetical protein
LHSQLLAGRPALPVSSFFELTARRKYELTPILFSPQLVTDSTNGDSAAVAADLKAIAAEKILLNHAKQDVVNDSIEFKQVSADIGEDLREITKLE